MTRVGLAMLLVTVTACGRVNFDPGLELTTAPLGGEWNTYARADDLAAPCDTSAPDLTFRSCVHLGTHREVRLPGERCDGLEIRDALGALQWYCVDDPDGARFISKGLRDDRRLRDLLDGRSWRSQHAEVSRDGALVGVTPDETWWTNPIVPLPDSSAGGPVALDGDWTVYVYDTTLQSGGYQIAADGVAIVAQNEAVLATAAGFTAECVVDGESGPCAVVATGRQFLWLELGVTTSASIDMGHQVALTDVRMSVVREHRDVLGDEWSNVALVSSRGNRVENVEVENPAYAAVMLLDSSGNRVAHLANRNSWNATLSLLRSHRNDIEHVFANHDDGDSVELIDSTNNRLRDLHVSRCEGYGVALTRSSDNTIHRVWTLDGDGPGILLDMADRNVLSGFALAGNGVDIGTGSRDNVLSDGIVIGTVFRESLRVTNAPGTTLAFVTVLSSPTDAVAITTSDRTTIANLVIGNIDGAGVMVTDSTDLTITALAVSDVTGPRIQLTNVASGAFHGALVLGPGAGCAATGAAPGIDATCAPSSGSTATARMAPALGPSFVGAVTQDDASNPSDIAGTLVPDFLSSQFPTSRLVELTQFEHRHRVWSRDVPFGSVAARSRCRDGAPSPCRIVDLRLRTADAELRQRAGGGAPLAAPTAETPCPAFLGGDVTITDRRSTPATFLAHAIEDVSDGIGNDDGLCESQEACTAAPNLGAYQGHGNRLSCTFVDGTVTGVTMRFWDTNGAD